MAVVATAATAVSSVPLAPTSAAGDRAAVVEIPDDDAPPPGWGQWENWSAPTPEPTAGVLVMREDGCMMARHSTHSAEPSSSHTATHPRWHRGTPGAREGAPQRVAGPL
jgi:hypothetical protein